MFGSLNLTKHSKTLHEILERAVKLNEISHLDRDTVLYDTQQGVCEGRSLMNISQVAVQLATLGENTVLQSHLHEGEEEVLILYEGDLCITMESKSHGIKQVSVENNGVIVIPPSVSHIASSINGCKLVAITVPSSPGYPNESK